VEISSVVAQLEASREGLSSMELFIELRRGELKVLK
jgi:hypothetical protein